ncbi:MAG TPA: hypothetical protein VFE31_08345 [Opitutaceae bacterium]|jgi:hypothetical protein|nr:hypothetical protein [Opitutaceae bacterium]
MDKAERAKLLRQRFQAKGGLPYPVAEPRRADPVSERTNFRQGWYAPETDISKRAPGWVYKPDPVPRPIPQPKRRNGQNPIVKIAARYPVRFH